MLSSKEMTWFQLDQLEFKKIHDISRIQMSFILTTSVLKKRQTEIRKY